MLYRKQRKEVFRMPKYIAVYNNKGGSSKTKITYQIATILSKKMPKKNILVIDMDEQVNITKRMTGTEENENPINRLIVDNLFVEEGIICPQKEEYPNLYLIPGAKGLNVLDKHFSKQRAEEHVLRKYLQKNKEELENYEYIFFDMSPTSSIINLNVFTSITKFGGSFLVPLFFRMTDSLSGAERFIETYDQDMEDLEIENRAKIFTFINGYRKANTKANNGFEFKLDNEYSNLKRMLLNTKINDSDVVVNAMEQSLSVEDYVLKNKINSKLVVEQFNAFIEELIEKEVL